MNSKGNDTDCQRKKDPEKNNLFAPAVTEKHTLLFRDGRSEVRREPVLTEYHLSVFVDGVNAMQLVCTPEYLGELVWGRLLTAGIIKKAEDVESLEICRERRRAEVFLKDAGKKDVGKAEVNLFENRYFPEENAYASQSEKSGQTVQSVQYMQPVRTVDWKPEWIFALADHFHRGLPLHDRTWGTHSCFLSRGGRLLFQCEDIGRHNAMDKVIGYALKEDIRLGECIVYSSGRVPLDMAEKAVRAGIPVLAAKAVPTREAVRLAKRCGLTLIGSARSDTMKVYADGMKESAK